MTKETATPETDTSTETNDRLKKVQQTAQAALDELNKAFHEHADLARKQYGELTEKYGDPKDGVEHFRVNAERLVQELETHAKDVAERVRRYVPIGGNAQTSKDTAGGDGDLVVETVDADADEGDDTPEVPTGE